jgi:hypothetical protein
MLQLWQVSGQSCMRYFQRSGTDITKKADAKATLGAVFTIWTAGLIVSEEE